MQLISCPRRALGALVVVVVAAVGVSCSATGTGVAQAALGGAQPSAFADAPDLESVTVSAAFATFTFREAVRPGPAFAPAAFRVGGYESDFLLDPRPEPRPVVESNSVVVPVTGPDADNLTFGTVLAEAVVADRTGGRANVADSAPITGASGQSGTRGRTVSCDLSGAIPDAAANTMTFAFDQACDPETTRLVPNAFRLLRADGTVSSGQTVVAVAGSHVRVRFPAAAPIGEATEAFVLGGALRSANAPLGNLARFTQHQNVDVAGTGAASLRPYVTEARIAGPQEIAYTFNVPVVIREPLGFQAVLADSTHQASISARVDPARPNVAVARFVAEQYTEFLVYGSVLPNAVRSAAGVGPAVADTIAGGRPVGGNAAALATGYTDAPEVQDVAFGSDRVRVTLDSRIRAGSAPLAQQFNLLDAGGGEIGGTPTLSIGLNATPGPVQVEAVYGAGVVDGARAFQLGFGAVRSSSPDQSANLVQVVGR